MALLPPTLIASVYGMNFKGYFPELLAIMLAVGWFMRRRAQGSANGSANNGGQNGIQNKSPFAMII